MLRSPSGEQTRAWEESSTVSTRTRIYLDIDGVLNVMGVRRGPAGWPGGWTSSQVGYTQVTVSRAMLGAVFRLPADEIVWCTTWEEDADRLFAAALELPRGLRHLPLGQQDKLPALGGDLRQRPVARFVVVDDAVGDQDPIDAIGRDCDAAGLGVRPRMDLGLSAADVAQICRFLAG